MHAVDHLKTHDKLIEAVEHLARLPVRVFFVVLPKDSTPASAAMRSDDIHVYNFLARVLNGFREILERFFGSIRQNPRSEA